MVVSLRLAEKYESSSILADFGPFAMMHYLKTDIRPLECIVWRVE